MITYGENSSSVVAEFTVSDNPEAKNAAEELSDLLDKMTPEQLAALKEQIQKKEAEEKADEQ